MLDTELYKVFIWSDETYFFDDEGDVDEYIMVNNKSDDFEVKWLDWKTIEEMGLVN